MASVAELIDRGIKLYMSGRLREAREAFELALEQDPKNGKARSYLVHIREATPALTPFPGALAAISAAEAAPARGAAVLLPAPGPPQAAAAPPAAAAPAVVPNDLQAYLDQQEREILVKALKETNFNRTAAAQRLGLSLRQIRYRIARLAIATPGSEEPDDSAGT